MELRKIAEYLTQALEEGDFERSRNYLSDDFTFESPDLDEPIGVDEWEGLSRQLLQAMPDLSYNFQIEGVEGNTVHVSSQFTGTHEEDLDLTNMGMGVIPATGEKIETVRQPSEGVVENGQFQHIKLMQVEGGGFSGVLEQLGVQPPAS